MPLDYTSGVDLMNQSWIIALNILGVWENYW